VGDTDQPNNLTDILDRLEEQTDGQYHVELRNILEAFAYRLHGPMILVPGLLVVSPLGMIPTFPTVLGLLIVVAVSQLVIGVNPPWVPKELRERSVERQAMVKSFKHLRPWTRRVDRLTAPRLTFLTNGPMLRVWGVLAVLLGLSMPPLELVPMACFVPGLGVCLIGLTIVASDGILGLIAITAAVGTAYLFLLAAGPWLV